MKQSSRETTLLLYCLGFSYNSLNHPHPFAIREEPGTGIFPPILGYAWDNLLTPQLLSDLISYFKSGKNYIHHGMNWFFVEGDIYVRSESLSLTWHESSSLVIAELERLSNRYKDASKRGITLRSGLLHFIGNNWLTRNLLLKALAHNHNFYDVELAQCWEFIEIYGLDSFSPNLVEQVKKVVDRCIQEEMSSYCEAGLGEVLLLERYGDLMQVSIPHERATCSSKSLVSELQDLLEDYSQAAENKI